MRSAHTIWITGLSRSGKTTIAEGISEFLQSKGRPVEIIDGSQVRSELGDFFGYSQEERMKVSRVLCSMAKLLAKRGVIPIVASITPYQESRDYNRHELSPYVEIFVECDVEICVSRDTHNLYRKAMIGDIKHFIGIDDPYEVPKNYDLRINTSKETPEQSIAKTISFIETILDETE